MLTHVQVKNLAVVSRLDLALQGGMTALTGETGAGKSILVDAVGLALGDRADSDMIRHGEDRAEVTLEFEAGALPGVCRWLVDRELDADGSCLIRRTLSREGRSRGYINGTPVPIQLLRELGALLVDIHGQHEHQSLLRATTQGELLDAYAATTELVAQVRAAYAAWRQARERHAQLAAAAADRAARAELLRYQVQELDALELAQDEVSALDSEHARLSNVDKLQAGLQAALEALYDNEQHAVTSILERCADELSDNPGCDPQLAALVESLQGAAEQVRDASHELRRYSDHLEADPERLQTVEQRIAVLHELSRKHRVPAEQLPELAERLRDELTELDLDGSQLGELEQQVTQHAHTYAQLAKKLSAARAQAAHAMAQHVSANMQELGMPGGAFEIRLQPNIDDDPNPNGGERIEFQVSANPGQPVKPLTKVASGGELSRISLAIQVAAVHLTPLPTLVFDEVDVGIGGGVAEIVGRQLRTLGGQCQVLCVTHLPQVAAQAHHHLFVAKRSDGKATNTAITPLDRAARVGEVARMLGGVEITEQTRAHAAEMIARAGDMPDPAPDATAGHAR